MWTQPWPFPKVKKLWTQPCSWGPRKTGAWTGNGKMSYDCFLPRLSYFVESQLSMRAAKVRTFEIFLWYTVKYFSENSNLEKKRVPRQFYQRKVLRMQLTSWPTVRTIMYGIQGWNSGYTFACWSISSGPRQANIITPSVEKVIPIGKFCLWKIKESSGSLSCHFLQCIPVLFPSYFFFMMFWHNLFVPLEPVMDLTPLTRLASNS